MVIVRSCLRTAKALASGLVLLTFAGSALAQRALDEELRATLIMGFSSGKEERAGAAQKVKRLLDQGADPNYASGRPVLSYAIEDAPISVVKLLLDRGASLKERAGDEQGFLQLAVEARRRSDNLEIVNLFISRGADPNFIGKFNTALGSACDQLSLGLVTLLLKSGADPNLVAPAGHSPLVITLRSVGGDKSRDSIRSAIAGALLESGAKPDLVDPQGAKGPTPDVHITASLTFDGEGGWEALEKRGGKELEFSGSYYVQGSRFRFGLSLGAEQPSWMPAVELWIPLSKDRTQFSVLGRVFTRQGDENDDDPLVGTWKGSWMGSGSTLEDSSDYVYRDGRTALSFVAEKGPVDLAKKLIERGADVNRKDRDGRTPLYYALGSKGQEDVARSLLAAGAAIDIRAPGGADLLFASAATMPGELVSDLVRKSGAPLSIKDSRGASLLHSSARGGNASGASALLKLGADASAKDNAGFRPFDYACASGSVETIKLLAPKLGAKASGGNSRGLAPIHLAVLSGNAEAIRVVQSLGGSAASVTADGLSPLHVLAQVRSVNTTLVKQLLAGGARIDARDKAARTPLIWAVLSSNEGAAKSFIASGANVNVADAQGNSALHAAAVTGDLKIVKLLLANKASRTLKNKSGRTPLDVARGGESLASAAGPSGRDVPVNMSRRGGGSMDVVVALTPSSQQKQYKSLDDYYSRRGKELIGQTGRFRDNPFNHSVREFMWPTQEDRRSGRASGIIDRVSIGRDGRVTLLGWKPYTSIRM